MKSKNKIGRPVSLTPRQRTQISLTPLLMAKFKELGASRWVANQLKIIMENNNVTEK